MEDELCVCVGHNNTGDKDGICFTCSRRIIEFTVDNSIVKCECCYSLIKYYRITCDECQAVACLPCYKKYIWTNHKIDCFKCRAWIQPHLLRDNSDYLDLEVLPMHVDHFRPPGGERIPWEFNFVCCGKLLGRATPRIEPVTSYTCLTCGDAKCSRCGYTHAPGECGSKRYRGGKCKGFIVTLVDYSKMKNCPSCLSYLEIHSGCKTITCSNCFYVFCWENGNRKGHDAEVNAKISELHEFTYKNVLFEKNLVEGLIKLHTTYKSFTEWKSPSSYEKMYHAVKIFRLLDKIWAKYITHYIQKPHNINVNHVESRLKDFELLLDQSLTQM